MKALTVKNPWAWLIVQGLKDIENRTWRTNFRGRIFIHSSAVPDPLFTKGLVIDQGKFKALNHEELLYLNRPRGYTNSEILGSVEIIDCVQNHPSRWSEPGSWHWVLANPQPAPQFFQTKFKGTLSFWDITKDRII